MSNLHKTVQRVSLPQSGKLLAIEPLDYDNPYDVNRMHRHDYFELILVREGQGTQLIDCATYTMGKAQLFSIYPGQIHLMHRGTATGLLIQFPKALFEHTHPLKHYQLYLPSPVIALTPDIFGHLYDIAGRMQQLLKQQQCMELAHYKAYHYLQILLISMLEQDWDRCARQDHNILTHFLSLVTHQVHLKKKVSDYCMMMGCNAEKLNKACKEILGKNALELIHEELMLEIRRLMLLGSHSLKDITYGLNFDSQQTFSAFVKTKTGMAPSDLQIAVRNIY